MLKSLRARNIALLIVVVLTGQLLTTLAASLLLVKPQTDRLAFIMARTATALSATMDTIPDDKRTALIAKINAGGVLRILPADTPPPEDRGIPTLVEAQFMRSFAKEMAQNGVVIWHGGRTGQLWARIILGGRPYWLAYERPKGLSPTGALFASVSGALALALIAGIILQRRLDRSLKTLARAADDMRGDGAPERLSEDGPEEIATVASAFNRMGNRLAAQEADRRFMLAGISHDLRTPLAKIRLALEMIPDKEAVLEDTLNRQLDQVDSMLAQFLDFARGAENEAFVSHDIVSFVREVTASLDPAIEVVGNTGITAPIRPLALHRALTNLVHNAQLYGALPIAASVTQQGETVRIAVLDHGTGAPPAQLASLSDPFVRGNVSRSGTGGSGLGLAITRHIAESHGGALELANLNPHGFSATIILPLERTKS